MTITSGSRTQKGPIPSKSLGGCQYLPDIDIKTPGHDKKPDFLPFAWSGQMLETNLFHCKKLQDFARCRARCFQIFLDKPAILYTFVDLSPFVFPLPFVDLSLFLSPPCVFFSFSTAVISLLY